LFGPLLAYLAKYDSNLALQWAYSFDDDIQTGYITPQELEIDNSGDIIISGVFEGDQDFNTQGNFLLTSTSTGADESFFIAKYANATGALIDAVRNNFGSAAINKMTSDGLGRIFLTGNFNGMTDFATQGNSANYNANFVDVFIAAYDNSLVYLMAKAIGGASAEYAYGITTTAAGNIYICGTFLGVTDFDPSAAFAYDTASVVGYTDMYVAAYSITGNYLWSISMDGNAGRSAYAIVDDLAEGFYLTGSFSDSCDFDPSSAVAWLTEDYIQDVFLAKYSSTPVSVNMMFFDNAFTIYPNPATNYLYIKSNLATETSLKIYAMGGQLLKDEKVIPGGLTIDLTLQRGVYIVELTSGNEVLREKLVVR
jgi:hypothetical protein